MKQSIWTSGSPSNPQAFITKGKKRLKQFEGNVYLNDKEEFEIEIFNPKPEHTLAKIKIGDKYIGGGGIILRPGERVFLERFLDSSNKFMFTTYEVDGTKREVQEAIVFNGYVEVNFYSEYQLPNRSIYGSGTNTGTFTLNSNTTYTTNTFGTPFTLIATGGYVGTTTTGNTPLFSTGTSTVSNITPTAFYSNKMETGIVEKGDTSNQSFTYSNREFNHSPFWNVAWRILPNSQKQYHKEELAVTYCGECGSKRKKDSHKFCPHCGTKY